MATRKRSKKPRAKPKRQAAGPNVWRKAFLTSLALTGNVSLSATFAKVDRTTVYLTRQKDAAFGAAWIDALDQAADRLEAEILRRGVEGWDEPVYGSGGTG